MSGNKEAETKVPGGLSPGEFVDLVVQACNEDPDAQFTLAEHLEELSGDEDDQYLVAAFRLYERAAAHGHVGAAVETAKLYVSGHSPSPEQAAPWLRKAAAARDPQAMFLLGIMYREEIGVPRDPTKAAQLLAEAKALGWKDDPSNYDAESFPYVRDNS